LNNITALFIDTLLENITVSSGVKELLYYYFFNSPQNRWGKKSV